MRSQSLALIFVFPACAEKNGLDQCSQGPPGSFWKVLGAVERLLHLLWSGCRLVPQRHGGQAGRRHHQRHLQPGAATPGHQELLPAVFRQREADVRGDNPREFCSSGPGGWSSSGPTGTSIFDVIFPQNFSKNETHHSFQLRELKEAVNYTCEVKPTLLHESDSKFHNKNHQACSRYLYV